MPILLKIGNLVSKPSTNDFYSYIEDLEEFEKAVRRRQRYRLSSSTSSTSEVENFPSANPSSPIPSSSPSAPGATEAEATTSENVLDESPSAPGITNANMSENVVDESLAASRFQNLTFKEKLKRKGRPNKTTKQVSFRRTALDQTKKKALTATKKQKKTSKSKPESTKTFKNLVQEYSTDPPVNFHGVYDYSYPLPHWNMPNPAQMTNNFNSLAEINGPFMNHLHDEPIYQNL